MSENVVEKGKELVVEFYIDEDRWGIAHSHNVIIDCGEDCSDTFTCYDLSDCPEDAVIGRDLFDGYDYISAVEFGMKLAKMGYSSINIKYTYKDNE